MRDFPTVPEASITTGKLLEKLKDRGLDVSSNMLWKDVEDGYLPSSEKHSDGNKSGVVGLWDIQGVRRAVYLYRLRSRNIIGKLLKVILFLRDEWGWSEIKPICLDGLQKMILVQSSPVRKHLRNPIPTNVEFCIEEIIEETGINPLTAKFIYGIGLFGKPLDGGSLKHLFSTFQSIFNSGSTNKDKEFIELLAIATEQLISELNMSWEQVRVIVETADVAQVERARGLLRQQFSEFRKMLRQSNSRNKTPNSSTNFLTLFGNSDKHISKLLRSMPKRITTAQLLATCLVPAILLEKVVYEAEKALYEISPDLIPFLDSKNDSELDPEKVLQMLNQSFEYLQANADSEIQRQMIEWIRPMVGDAEALISNRNK